MALVTPTEPVPLEELGRVHFVGIGGAGHVRHRPDHAGQGRRRSPAATRPPTRSRWPSSAALGARVLVGHAAGHLGDADTLVVSSAIRADNPELVEANSRGLRVVHRAAALASLMFGRRVIAVTGTHGKTSTTSMITTVLLETGADPAYAIGGVLAATGIGAADGDGRLLRRRGGRERRLVPDVLAGRRRGHQRRRRPPGQLRDRGGLPRLVRRLPRPDQARRPAGDLRRRPRARATSPPRPARWGCGWSATASRPTRTTGSPG